MSKWENLLSIVFNHNCLVDNPPILFDIGASREIFPEWKDIAKYSICVAFDADNREMNYAADEQSKYKKLYVVNRIVLDRNEKEVDFYLTSSPFCSSVLKPDSKNLSEWSFAHLFELTKTVKLQTVNLLEVLSNLEIKQIDWFKTDSQGIDLKLFKSIEGLQNQTLAANFEPGFIDAYLHEDKIVELIQYMDSLPFWLSAFIPRGTKRMNLPFLNQHLDAISLRNIEKASVDSSCWAEITYLNKFAPESNFSTREYLLGSIFSIMLKQYGFASELALKGKIISGENIFDEVLTYIKNATSPKPVSLRSKLINFMVRKSKAIVNRIS